MPRNIIFVCADQLGARYLDCYGGPVPSTPTLSALAREGVRFDRCYATCPVCAPNRATMLTGRSPVIHGLQVNNQVLRTEMPTYAHVLRRAGYRTGGFGKFHQTPMHQPIPRDVWNLGFDESMITEDTKWGPWLEWVGREHPEHYDTALGLAWHNWPNTPLSPERARAVDATRRIYEPLRQSQPFRLMWPSPLPAELHDTTFITNCGLDFIRRHRAEHADQPFFCHISYVDPHDPYDPPAPYSSMFRPEDMPDALPADWLADPCPTLRANQVFHGFERIYDKPEVVRQLRAFYHGSMRFMDDQIARIVTYLRKADLWNDTVLLFTSDHGDLLGDHGLLTKGEKPYDGGVRCPLVVAGGGSSAGSTDRLTCTLDLFPTFCDWADVPAAERPPVEGRSFAPVCAGLADPDPWPAVSVAYGSVESVVSADQWRLSRFVDDNYGQLFNLADDPDEQRNLYCDPASAARRQRMLEQLVDVMARPRRIRDYRAMPAVNGRKMDTPGGELIPLSPVF